MPNMAGSILLSEMVPGQLGTIRSFRRTGGEMLRLMELGLLPGTEVRFVRKAPLGDPLEVELRGFHLSLRATEASVIDIEPIQH